MTLRLRLLVGVTLVALALSATKQAYAGPRRGSLPLNAAAVTSNRLVVKYRSQVSRCAHCLLARGIPFASTTGTHSLDLLHRQLGVRRARALHPDGHGPSAERSRRYLQSMAQVQTRYRARTAAASSAALPDLSNVFVLELDDDVQPERAAGLYQADPAVEYAHPDYELHANLIPNDPFFASSGTWNQSYPDLWGHHICGVANAWDTANGTGKVVAVIDSGIDYDHPDLSANIWINTGEIAGNGADDDGNGFVDDLRGWDFVDDENDPMDEHGHGTHVAGTVAATGNNARGIAGMAWGARIMSVRGLDAEGRGYSSDLTRAVLYAAENGADVLNSSWGGFSLNLIADAPSVLRDAVETASALGVVVVAAAGNDNGSADVHEPSGYPTVIGVAASDAADQRASFSNFGDSVSVAAPGVDVLSLRSAISDRVDEFGALVGADYLRLNGTSMASPHAAGLSALLLSALPSLTPDEVRWRLELNADQPGYPGYESQLRNPYFGYGRINAARIFDLPPVTTRLRGAADLHVYAGDVLADAASANFAFTTRDSIGWSVSSPPWLVASSAAGTGDAQLSFDVDATSLGVGHYAGDVGVNAPAAADGGDTFPAALETHADPRIGDIITVSSDYVAKGIAPAPATVAADGVGQLIAWGRWHTGPPTVYTARIDGAGNLHGPYAIHSNAPGVYPVGLTMAFDGRNHLLFWRNYGVEYPQYSSARPRYRTVLMAMRVSASGEPLDAAPIVLMEKLDSGKLFVGDLRVGFDGEAYTLAWQEGSFTSDRGKIWLQRMGVDGSVRGRRKKIQPNRLLRLPPHWIDPSFACVRDGCALVWGVRTGRVTPAGYFLDDVYAVRLDGTAIVDSTPIHLFSDINLGLGEPLLASDGNGEYLTSARRLVECDGAFCGVNIVAARMTANGVVRDPQPLQINSQPLTGVGSPQIAFDGINYNFAFIGGGTRFGRQIFALRLAPDGSVVDTEAPGALLLPDSLGTVPPSFGTSMGLSIAGTPTQVLLTWVDTLNFDPGSSSITWTNPISVQRVFPHALPAGFATRSIGSIGALDVAEREMLTFMLTAPGVASATFSGVNLPPGAEVDPTGIFRWTPTGDESGVYPAVRFEATNGAQAVNETLTITITEASLSLGGTVRHSTGAVATGIALKISGPAGASSGRTDATGRFRFEDLVPGKYRIRLSRPSTESYIADVAQVEIAAVDEEVDLTISPK